MLVKINSPTTRDWVDCRKNKDTSDKNKSDENKKRQK